MPEERDDADSGLGTHPPRSKFVSGKYYDIATTLFSTGRSGELVDLFIAAARDGDFNRIENLLERRGDAVVSVDVKDKRTGNTPLIWASKRGHTKIVQLLLKHGADVTLKNYDGHTAVEAASPVLKTLLLDTVEHPSLSVHQRLLQAAWQGNAHILKQLLSESRTLDIDCQNGDGLTPLLLLCRDLQLFERLSSQLRREFDPLQVLSILLEHRANIHATDNDGKSCLHYVSQSKSKSAKFLVDELLQQGSQTELRDRQCFTPIHCASQTGNVDVIHSLIDGGSEVNVRGFAGATPLHYTAYNDHDRAAATLLHHGADILLTDDQGLTALDVARSKKMKSRLREAWTEVAQSRQEVNLAPVREPTRDGSRLSMRGDTPDHRPRGEVLFDGLPLNPFTNSLTHSKVKLLKPRTPVEKARLAEEYMLAKLESSPLTTNRDGVRRLGIRRQSVGYKPAPLPVSSRSSERLPPVNGELGDCIVTKSRSRPGVHYQRSLTDLSKSTKNNKLAKLYTYPRAEPRKGMSNLNRDSPISILRLASDLDDDYRIRRLCGTPGRQTPGRTTPSMLITGRHSPNRHPPHRRSNSDSSPSLAQLTHTCNDYLHAGRRRCISTPSCLASDDFDTEEEELRFSPRPSPRHSLSPSSVSNVRVPQTIDETRPTPKLAKSLPTLAQMRLTKSCTPVHRDTIFPNSKKLLPPSPILKSLSNLERLVPSDSKDISPRSSGEFEEGICLASDGKVIQVERPMTRLKTEFIIEESRPKDPLFQSSGSDSCDSVESNPAKNIKASQDIQPNSANSPKCALVSQDSLTINTNHQNVPNLKGGYHDQSSAKKTVVINKPPVLSKSVNIKNEDQKFSRPMSNTEKLHAAAKENSEINTTPIVSNHSRSFSGKSNLVVQTQRSLDSQLLNAAKKDNDQVEKLIRNKADSVPKHTVSKTASVQNEPMKVANNSNVQKPNSGSKKMLAVQPTKLISSMKKRAILRTKQTGQSDIVTSSAQSRLPANQVKAPVMSNSPKKSCSVVAAKASTSSISETPKPLSGDTKSSNLRKTVPQTRSVSVTQTLVTQSTTSASTITSTLTTSATTQNSKMSDPETNSVIENTQNSKMSDPETNSVIENTQNSQMCAPETNSGIENTQNSQMCAPETNSVIENRSKSEARNSTDMVGKTPLVKIFASFSDPRLSDLCMNAPQIQQTPLIVNPFEDFFSKVSGAIDNNNVTSEQNNTNPVSKRAGSASSKKPQAKSVKNSKPPIQKAKQQPPLANKKRVSSGRKRGHPKSAAADDKRPNSNTRPKTAGKSNKRVRSGKVRGKKSEKENLGDDAAKSDVALISGIGWHIATSCDDKSDIHAVKLDLDSDSSDDEHFNKVQLCTPRFNGLRPFSSPSPRFVEVKTETDEQSLNQDIPPINLDMSRNTINRHGVSRSWEFNLANVEVIVDPASEISQPLVDVLQTGHDFYLNSPQELMLSKLSPIPESPSLLSRTTSALENFSKKVSDDLLNEILGGYSDVIAHSADLKRKDKDMDSDSDSDDTIVSSRSQHSPDNGHGVIKRGKDEWHQNMSTSKSQESKFIEMKQTDEVRDDNLDEIVEEILSSTGPPSLNSTLRSNKSASSRNSTLTEADVKILRTLHNTESPFHAKPKHPETRPVRESLETEEHFGTNPDLLRVFHADDFKLGQKMKAMIDAGAESSRVEAMLEVESEAKHLERIIHSFKRMELVANSNQEMVDGPRESSHSPHRGRSSTLEHPKHRRIKALPGRPHSAAGMTSASKARRGRFTEIKEDSIPKNFKLGTEHPSIGEKTVEEAHTSQTEHQYPVIHDSPSKHSEYDSHDTGQRSSSACSSNSTQSMSEEDTICWKKGNILGRGAFGTVWCGLTGEGELIAVKQIELNTSVMKKAKREYEKIQEEVELLKTLTHKNIVGYLGTSFEDDFVSIYMQFVPGGSIASILARFGALEERVFCLYTKQILQGVEYLHDNDVIHRDIKGGNIMLMPTGVIKLIDFGCAKRLCINLSMSRSQILKSMKGTPYWMAPEVVNETGHGKKSDIWSIGCTVFEMATRKPPWSEMSPIAAIFAIGCDRPIPELPEKFSKDVREFVSKCLTRDQNVRMSASEGLQHRFITRRRKSRAV